MVLIWKSQSRTCFIPAPMWILGVASMSRPCMSRRQNGAVNLNGVEKTESYPVMRKMCIRDRYNQLLRIEEQLGRVGEYINPFMDSQKM